MTSMTKAREHRFFTDILTGKWEDEVELWKERKRIWDQNFASVRKELAGVHYLDGLVVKSTTRLWR